MIHIPQELRAQDISFTAHRARSLGKDLVARSRSLGEGYRPPLGSRGGYLADNWLKMTNHDRHSNNQHVHVRLYPRGIQRMAHEDGGLAP